jgi:hypothetical protein
LVATCCRDFHFKLDDWNQMYFCQHILLAISTASCLSLEFESVLERLHSGKCGCFLRIWCRNFDFKLGDWNQMHFCQHILLAISTASCLSLEFESVLESLHSGKCDCHLRIWLQHALEVSISSRVTGTRCIFANIFCWLSQEPHVWVWNLKAFWKVCIQANATVSSEFGCNMLSRFRF